jgi:hypothetical protein
LIAPHLCLTLLLFSRDIPALFYTPSYLLVTTVSSSVAFACCLARSTLSSTKPLLLLCFCFLDAHAASYHVLLAPQVEQHLLAIPSCLPFVGAAVQSIFRPYVILTL